MFARRDRPSKPVGRAGKKIAARREPGGDP
jgi:hypothetical protein